VLVADADEIVHPVILGTACTRASLTRRVCASAKFVAAEAVLACVMLVGVDVDHTRGELASARASAA
jgi:hypothetical protein